jgi:DNA-binding CsgD family transcriptional regulator
MSLDDLSIAIASSGLNGPHCPTCLQGQRARHVGVGEVDRPALLHPHSGDPTHSGSEAVSAHALASALDLTDYGVLLLAAGKRVVHINHAAREELADTRHPLQLHGQELHVRQPEDHAAVRLALAKACEKKLQHMLSIGGHDCVRTVLSILPIPKLGPRDEAGAMVVLARRLQWAELTTVAFARSHRLTRAEVRVLTQLCAGLRPTEVARAHNVAVSTVRSQIRSLREKTGASCVADLIRQVSRLPPMPPRSAVSRCPRLVLGH